MISIYRTDVGRKRKTNEDAGLCTSALFAVADGMGGHKAGEVASNIAIEHLKAISAQQPDIWSLEKVFISANQAIATRALDESQCAGMGTTLTALWLAPNDVLVAHVGDSRAYLLRDGKLEQITTDHSIVAELVRKGVITPQEARKHPYRNVITRALGTSDSIEVDLLQLSRKKQDIWLICSDGLTGMLSDERIKQVLVEAPLEKAADVLIKEALKAGGSDNITLILLQDEEESE